MLHLHNITHHDAVFLLIICRLFYSNTAK